MSFRTKVDSNGRIKWGVAAPLFFVSIVLFGFIGQYAIMGQEVNDTSDEVRDLDSRVYAVEKSVALSNNDIRHIKETVDNIERKFDLFIDK